MAPKIAIQKTRPGNGEPWEYLVVDHEGDGIYADGVEPTFERAVEWANRWFESMIEDADVTIDHDNHETDVLYVGRTYVSGHPVRNNLSVFYTPDCVGRYYYDSVAEARVEHGDLPIRYVARIEL